MAYVVLKISDELYAELDARLTEYAACTHRSREDVERDVLPRHNEQLIRAIVRHLTHEIAQEPSHQVAVARAMGRFHRRRDEVQAPVKAP